MYLAVQRFRLSLKFAQLGLGFRLLLLLFFLLLLPTTLFSLVTRMKMMMNRDCDDAAIDPMVPSAKHAKPQTILNLKADAWRQK